MHRCEQSKINKLVINRVAVLLQEKGFLVPPYRAVVSVLNLEGYKTSRNNEWTSRRLFRMLQRNGFGGLWGLRKQLRQSRNYGINTAI